MYTPKTENGRNRRALRDARKNLRSAREHFGRCNFHMATMEASNGLKNLRGMGRTNPFVLSLRQALRSIKGAADARL